jgi:tetratricopeptide (TPR) repeat protein
MERRTPLEMLPPDVTAADLDAGARAQLRTLPSDLADAVARWLVAAGREEDPDRAYAYARQARELAARVGVVRETSGIAAYRVGRWAEALAELRTARRLTGDPSYLPLMADSERALGRPDRALALIEDPAVRDASRTTQIELRIVASGIRRDQGRPEAAVAVLQVPELTDGRWRPWSARLFYAYADALLEAGREEEAREWFGRSAAADTVGDTDAADRYEELDHVLIEDLAELAGAGADGGEDRTGADGPRGGPEG